MKKKLLVMLTLGAVLFCAACSDDEPETVLSIELSSTDVGVTVSDNKSDAAIYTAEGSGSFTFDVTTNYGKLTLLADDDSWLSSDYSNSKITIGIDENPMSGNRTNKVKISVGTQLLGTISVTQTGGEAATLEVDADRVILPLDGGSQSIKAFSNKPLGYETVEEGAGWLTVSVSADAVVFSCGANTTRKPRKAAVTVFAGVGDNRLSEEVTVEQGNGDMVIVMEIPEDNTLAYLPFNTTSTQGTYPLDVVVDWGDGLRQPLSYISSPPFYLYPKAGTYEVRISGTAGLITTQFGEFNNNQQTICMYPKEIKAWGRLNVQSMRYGLRYLNNITSLPADIDGCLENCTDFYSAFTGMPLEEISPDLFKYAVNAETFYQAFNGTTLKHVPDGLFAGLNKATVFSGVFRNCAQLETIGEGVFAGCTEVESYMQAFYAAVNLKSIPVDIFDDSRKVTNFSNAFSVSASSDGEGLTGESPYTLINGQKVHLYERNDHPEEFTRVTTHTSAFARRGALADWEAIVAAGWAVNY